MAFISDIKLHSLKLGMAILITMAVVPAQAGSTAKQAISGADDGQLRAQRYDIRSGDTLSEIFERKGIPAIVLHELLAADVEYLALETLWPGTELTFSYDSHNLLQSLAVRVDPARTVFYQRQADETFLYRQLETDTHWKPGVLAGSIQGSFYASALMAGLTKGQIAEFTRLLRGKVNFRRDLRAGDSFSIVIGNETTGNEATGRTRIDAVSLHRGTHVYSAYLFEDGNYYDDRGESTTAAFLRWPTFRRYRISSPFYLKRLHPVTGRVKAHNGVDLAMPIGTPVLTTGGGIVSRTGKHPFAGNYIDIGHGGSFSTRYLHLSKLLVKSGQRVERGQKIALSGNTGRTTGAHLHFEFHVNGRPVNPLTADIPVLTNVAKNKIAAFYGLVSRQTALMSGYADGGTLLAERPSSDASETN